MVTAIHRWKTNTMIFDNSETVHEFLSYFSEELRTFEDLNRTFFESKQLEKFSIQPKGLSVVFLWKFKERQDYDQFMSLLRNTSYYSVIYRYFGWNLANMGSA